MNVNNLVEAAETLTGFVIVMIALTVLWGLTTLTGRIFAGRVAKATVPGAVPASAAGASPPAAASEENEVDDDLVVVAAAAASLLATTHRIVSVRPVDSSWGRQGRRDIHASHRIR
jgi:hypothetical protein